MVESLDSLTKRMQISSTYAASVGYFLMAFAYAEEEMNRTIWSVLSLNARGGHEITSSFRDFGQRMLLLARLGKATIHNDEIRKDCSTVIRGLQFINDRRVDLVHGMPAAWIPDHDRVLLERTTAERDYIRHHRTEFSTEFLCELTEYALLVRDATHIFRESVERGHRQELPSLGKRPELSPMTDIQC